MPFTIENSAGDILGDGGKDEAGAIEKARAMLSDDPELGELLVLEWREVATVTHGPNADWQSVVVVLKPGEKIQPPDNRWKMPRMCDEEFNAYVEDAYGDDWPKAEGMRQMREKDYMDGLKAGRTSKRVPGFGNLPIEGAIDREHRAYLVGFRRGYRENER